MPVGIRADRVPRKEDALDSLIQRNVKEMAGKPTFPLYERNGIIVEPDPPLGMPFVDSVDWARESGNSLRICFCALPV